MAAPTKNRRDLRRAKVQIMLKHKFYATLAAHLPCIPKPAEWFAIVGIAATGAPMPPTACVDGKRIYFCPEFVETLTDKQAIGLLVHECLHPALGHLWRRGKRDRDTWLQATDYVVNGIIRNAVDDKGNSIFELPPNGLWNSRFDGMSVERVYTILRREQEDQEEQQPGQGPPQAGAGGGKVLDGQLEKPLADSEADDGEGDAEGKDKQDGDQDGDGGGSGSPGDQDDDGDSGDPKPEAPEPDFNRSLEERWRRITQEAAITAKKHGTLPGALESLVEEFTDPQIPWQRVVEQVANEIQRDDYDWKRPERRFLCDDIYTPDLYSPAACVAVFADSSGSISEGELRAFGGEVTGLLRCQGIKAIRFMVCDARIQLDEMLTPYDDPPIRFPGRGGTSFIPPFERLKEDPGVIRPSLIVYLTDMCGPFPTEDPGIPVLWIASVPEHGYTSFDELPKPPFGTVIEYQPLTDNPWGKKGRAA